MPESPRKSTRLKPPPQPLWNGHSYAHAIVQTVRQPLLVLDKDLRVKSANRAFCETFRVSLEETEGRLVYELGNGQWDIPKLRQFLEEILPHDGSFENFEVEHDFPTVGRKTMLLNARRLRQEGADTGLILLAIDDVTERRQAEEALRESEERFRTLSAAAPIGILLTDAEGEVVYTNERLRAISGLSPDESLGFHWTSIIHPEEREEMLAERSKAIAERREFDREFRMLTPQGEKRWVRVHTRPLSTQGGREGARVGVLEDITEHKQAEEDLRELKDALERRVAELDAFAYSVSHDLKEPLRAIEAYGRFVLEDYGDHLDEQGREYLKRLAAASVRMQRLIGDLLALSRASRPSRPSRVDVGLLVREVEEWMRPQMNGEGATVEVEDGLPEVAADSTQVEQIFRNLIGNGLKFNESGRPYVKVGFKGKEGRMGVFYIRDNGIGIEPQYHERIFTMFQRLHRREDYDGTGAGLAIVKRVVEYLGGRIWVESEAGAGSTFFVELPLCTKEAPSRKREAA